MLTRQHYYDMNPLRITKNISPEISEGGFNLKAHPSHTALSCIIMSNFLSPYWEPIRTIYLTLREPIPYYPCNADNISYQVLLILFFEI